MKKIRVLFANHPLMVPNAIRHLVAAQEDMEVVGDCRGPMKILQEVGRTKADAVILTQEGTNEPGLCSQLLAVCPDLIVMGVTPDTTTAVTLQLSIYRQEFANRHQEDILEPLRAAMRMSHQLLREG